MIKLM